MAVTPEGARLTELHRLLQVRLSTQAMAATRLLWSTLNPTDLVEAEAVWMHRQLQLMNIYDRKAADAAAEYMRRFRFLEGFPGGPIEAVDAFDAEWARSSLGYNSLGVIRAATAVDVEPEAAKQSALSGFMAATQRVALGGGRRVMDASSLANPESSGWRRIPDADPCSFCALLVSRGVYRSAKSAGEGRDWHRRCGCSVEEVFGEWTPNPREQKYVDAYDAAGEKLDQQGLPRNKKNVLRILREDGDFNDSTSRRPKRESAVKLPTINLDLPA